MFKLIISEPQASILVATMKIISVICTDQKWIFSNDCQGAMYLQNVDKPSLFAQGLSNQVDTDGFCNCQGTVPDFVAFVTWYSVDRFESCFGVYGVR